MRITGYNSTISKNQPCSSSSTSTTNIPEIYEVARVLKDIYHDFDHHNKKNPLNELLFILCTVKTSHRNYTRIYSALKRRFPTFKMLEDASPEIIAEAIKEGGLSNQRALAIHEISKTIVSHFGRLTLSPLQHMDNVKCEEFLTSLPRVGKKVARCVMLYSLGRKVFPVDTHCWRICRRLGWIQSSRRANTCSGADMDQLQAMIPPVVRLSLHVNMISLGREICTAIQPKCTICRLRNFCVAAEYKGI